ncbi:MAG: family 20 glycosylhydrolase [Candidatus Helarchaeota archaeon]
MKYLYIEGFDKLEKDINYKLHLLPFPQDISEISGFYQLQEELTLYFEDVNPKTEDTIVEIIMEELMSFGKMAVEKSDKPLPETLKNQKLLKKLAHLQENYVVFFRDSFFVIAALSDKGIYYGVNTFLQLIKPSEGHLIIPDLEIYDYPTYEIRCITDQTSRNQIPTLANLKKVIKLISKFKMNYHFLYFEDGFHFKKYPDLGKSRGGYTAEEIKELQDYAARYFVELVPIFESFGHVDNILMTNHPKYAHLGEFPGAAAFDIGNPEVKSFIGDLLGELCNTFNSEYFHLGLDETFDFGKFKTKELVKKKGKGEVMREYYEFLIKTVKKYGKKKVICYHDNLLKERTLLEDLPKDLIVFYWDYILKRMFFLPKRKYKKAKKIRENGFQVILSPTLYDYTANFPDINRTMENVVTMAKYGTEIDAIGIATSVWGDFLNECLRENNYFGYLITAEASWAPHQWNRERFKENFAYCFFGIDSIEIIQAFEYLNTYNLYHPTYPTKFYNHLWRHPFPHPKKIKAKLKKLDKVLEKNEAALQLIAKMRLKVTKNSSILDYMAYAAKLGIYVCKKYKIAQEIQRKLNKKEEDLHDNSKIIEQITYLKGYLQGLREEFETLWVRAAKPDGLNTILAKFDTHLFFYDKKLEEIKAGIVWEDPFLKAEFITAPKSVKQGDPIYIRKTFKVEKPVKKCHIQGMCNMLMHLYLNGEKLTEIVSKMSLSVEPIVQRIQLLDVTDKLHDGTNTIAAECYNYVIPRAAGNIYLEIEYISGETEVIQTTADWKASSVTEANWEQEDFNDTHWEQAKSYGPPPSISGHVTKPHVQAGIKSLESYYYGMDVFLKGFLPWAPSFLIKLGLKIVGLDIF